MNSKIKNLNNCDFMNWYINAYKYGSKKVKLSYAL